MGNDDISHKPYRPRPDRPHKTPYRPQSVAWDWSWI